MTRVADARGRQPGPRWRCPDARSVPEKPGKLAAWLAERGAAFYLEMLLSGSQQVRPPGPLPDSAVHLAADEHHRVGGQQVSANQGTSTCRSWCFSGFAQTGLAPAPAHPGGIASPPANGRHSRTPRWGQRESRERGMLRPTPTGRGAQVISAAW